MSSSIKKINVMHTVLSLQIGGLEKIVCDTVLGFDKERFNVEVCCFDTLGDLAEGLMENNIKVNLLQRNQEHYDSLFPVRLRRLLRKKNIHLLHMHSGTFFLGTQAGILARTPIMIYTDHGRHLVEPKFLFYMDRFSAIFADKIVAVSKELEEYLVNVVRLPSKKTITFINGIDTKKYSFREKSSSLMKEFGIAQNTKVIGTVGRLAEVKDQITMIEAFYIVRKKLPDTMLLLVGNGPMLSVLKQLVNDTGLTDNVLFVGNRIDVPDILNLFDLFLLTSLSEGTSVSLLEAMSSGVTPIVTDVGGNASIVQDQYDGIVVKPKQVNQIANNIIMLLQDDKLRLEFGKKAIDKVRTNYSLDAMINNYSDLYKDLIKSKQIIF